MREIFYLDRLAENGIHGLVPEAVDQETVHRIIVECLRIMGELKQRGAGGIILGCTELPLLLHPEDSSLPLFDTAILHAQAALERAIQA